ncbi:hypothetical protein KK083_25995 [Fulvivirgaceae bacterium PWU4]|uniref:ATP-binding protein n=1 Tax=Chryseosolibacter histidini TaxID=2782349 RepID=A0AAP2DPX4_9BACT|nr:hypothetical protein [Chryseosolibacter histidini]MBT1700366.1 hypothetical protein [Chryseosolibacter histidini]
MNPYALNPTAGTIPPSRIVGRAFEIKTLLQILESQSVLIEQFRRMGKTLLLQKLEHFTREEDHSNKAIYFILQGVRDPTEITDTLLNTLRDQRNFALVKSSFDKMRLLYNAIKPETVNIKDVSFKLPEFKSKWKDALTACLEDIADRKSDSGEILTLILDEFPMMLWNWLEAGKSNEAMELLDVLRNIRHSLKEKNNIRFLICGSIGMSVVLDRLRKDHHYTGEAFNDTANYSIEGMSKEDAVFLCECIQLSGFDCLESKHALFDEICELTENLPFYINKIFAIMALQSSSEISRASIKQAYDALLQEPIHSDSFNQLYTRIQIYYCKEDAWIMTGLLDMLCKHEEAVSEEDITQHIGGEPAVKLALATLTKEHYLMRSFVGEKRHYKFKYKLFRKWWKLNKA